MSPSPRPSVDTHFGPASLPPEAFSYQRLMAFGLSKAEAKKQVRLMKSERIVLSSTHQVNMRHVTNPRARYTWLSIKRVDKSPILDRTELTPIGEALCPGRVGFELLPSPERLVDTSNQYHLFCIEAPPLDDVRWATPPHLGDWRDLWGWKEREFPGVDAALVLTGHPRVGQVALAPPNTWFPFGWMKREVTSAPGGGAVQRSFSG